jgi:hypothetical protein
MKGTINTGFVRIVCSVVIVVVSMMLITCDDTSKNDKSRQEQTLFMLSGGTPQTPKCETVGGYCESSMGICGDNHVMWTSYGCPKVDGNAGACCLPTTSCAAVGGTCTPAVDGCASSSYPTGPMDCPGGDSDRCCIPLQ